MNDLILLLLALVMGVVMRKVRQKSGLSVAAARLGAVVVIAVTWVILLVAKLQVSVIAGIVAAGAAVLIVRDPRPDKISLRCSGCGNYYPSRDHFATDQLCNACHTALGGGAAE